MYFSTLKMIRQKTSPKKVNLDFTCMIIGVSVWSFVLLAIFLLFLVLPAEYTQKIVAKFIKDSNSSIEVGGDYENM